MKNESTIRSTVAFCHADIDGFRIVFLLNFLLHINAFLQLLNPLRFAQRVLFCK